MGRACNWEALTDGILWYFLQNVQFKKISILPPQKGLEFPGRWGFLEDQKI